MASLHYSSPYVVNSPSRIMKINNSNHTVKQPLYDDSHGTPHREGEREKTVENQLSPLQKLQIEYRGMLELEKERKMTLIHQKYEQKSLQALEKLSDPPRRVKNHPQEPPHRTIINHSNRRSSGYGIRKPRPRQLPPINHEKTVPKAQSFHGHNRFNTDDDISRVPNEHQPLPPPRNAPRSKPYSANQGGGGMLYGEGLDGHISPPPNIQHLRLLRERRLQQRRAKSLIEKERVSHLDAVPDQTTNKAKKLTDFERWQQQQDSEKIARLQKYHEEQTHVTGASQNIDLEFKVEYGTPKTQKKSRTIKKANMINGMAKSKRSASPMVPAPVKRKDSPQRQEALRQKVREDEIEKLKDELRRRQEELKLLQKARLDSCGNGFSSSDNESDYEARHPPKHKAMKKISTRNTPHIDGTKHTTLADERGPSDVAFQMKPVLIRRDSGRNSRTTPKQDHTQSLVSVKEHVETKSRNATATKHRIKIPAKQKRHPPPTPPLKFDPPPPKINPSFDDEEFVPRQASQYTIPEEGFDDEVNLRLVPCQICGRKFSDDRLSKHMKVCKKTTNKKRKVFNMSKARVKGTEMEKYTRKDSIMRRETPPKKESNWRAKHENFIRAIRDAKTYQEHIAKGGKPSDLPPPPPADNPDYVQCRYCQRKFAPAVAERHIPRCKDIKSRPRPPRR